MRLNIYFVIVWLICILACKNEKGAENYDQTTLQNNKVENKIFKVFVEVKVREDDKFQLFYIDNTSDGSYKADKRITSSVSGKNDFQVVEFLLPFEVIPSKFRIDVGETGAETIIEIREVKLRYNSKVIKIDNKVLSRFFKPNIYLKEIRNGFVRTKLDGKYDPFFASTALLNKKIQLEF